jgi:FkbM family methyltransferase
MSSRALKATISRQLASHFPKLWMERELRLRPNHFEDEFWVVPLLCDKQKTSIDIGANMGHYSYYLAKFSRNVIAFEPNRDLWNHLRRLLGRKVHLESAALSRAPSKAVIRIDRHNTGVSTIEQRNDLSCVSDKSAVVAREIETRTLDSFNFSDIAMIKIDVEGHEEAVLEGARDTIRRNQPALIVESEDRHNPGAPRRIAESLAALGYLCFYLKDRRLCDFSTLRRKTPTQRTSTQVGPTSTTSSSSPPPNLHSSIASKRTLPPAQGPHTHSDCVNVKHPHRRY